MNEDGREIITEEESGGFDLASTLGVNVGAGPKKVRRANNFGKTVKRLIKYLRPEAIALIGMILCAIIGAWFGVWVPEILKKVTNHLVESITYFKAVNMSYVAGILWTSVGLYVLNALFQLTSGMIAASMSQRVVRRMRSDIKDKYDRVALKYFDATPTGDLLSRLTNDVELVSVTLQDSINQIITGVMTIVGVLAMMLRIDPVLALVAIVSFPLYALVTMLIVKRSEKEFAKQQKFMGKLNGHIEEMYTGHNVVKLYNREKNSIEDYGKINEDLKKATKNAQFLAGTVLPLMKFVNNLVYVAICVFGAFRAGAGKITIGDIQAFIQYAKQFASPIENVANIANTIQSAVAAAERVFEVLDLEEMAPDKETQKDMSTVRGDVSFEHVAFSYVEGQNLITDIHLDVKAGESVAIVGPTGAGKTTLVNLLMRFYEIGKGSIRIDGADIRDYSRNDLRSLYGMVLQDTWLFNGTVAENIAYGKADATREEIIAAAKEAYADSFIETMENGYDTVLAEDATNISAGQRQLLTIARAILKNPKIIILDEATSSVDTRTEVYVQKAMLKMMEGRTSFVIAHRLSTIKHAENIIVMKDGDVVETGNHETLMEKGGFYKALYQSQFSEGKAI